MVIKMKKSILICLIILSIALFMYFVLVRFTFSLCWEGVLEENPYNDDYCGSNKRQFFFRVIGRGVIYWTTVFFIMLIIFLTVKEDKSKNITPKIE